MAHILWRPSAHHVANCHMTQFIQQINQTFALRLTDYAALYQWSITHPEQFWPALSDYCQVIYSQPWEKVLINPEKMPGAQWFSGARLNFAENLLRYQDQTTALIAYNECGERRIFSYAQLYQEVAKLAAALRAAGITVNDRIAGFLPNIPETIIAMLATTSIGAIWSACSPDFGIDGAYDRFHQIQPKLLFAVDGYRYNGRQFNTLEKVSALREKITSIQQVILIPYLENSVAISSLQHTRFYQDFLISAPPPLEFAQLPFDHPIYIVYSSGTTGIPKCIVHGAGGVLLQHLKEHQLHTDLHRKDILFYMTTCGWMMWNWLASGLATGASLVLYEGAPLYPKYRSLFDLIEKEKITVFGTSAKFISTLEKVKIMPIKTHNLSQLRTILSTGSPLLPANYDYVYRNIKADVCLASISGGTDILSCFALGNPLLPIYRGELQCRGLGLSVTVVDEQGLTIHQQKGELVCTAPFPAMPVGFWNDPTHEKYSNAYFTKFPQCWAHGDYAELTVHDGLIIYGRSDTTLNPSGIRIGTAEIYRQIENIADVLDCLAIAQEWKNDVRIVLFVKLQTGVVLNGALKEQIKHQIRHGASPHHVPEKIIQVADIPKTFNGKTVELAVREIIHQRPVKNIASLANPEALAYFKNIPELAY